MQMLPHERSLVEKLKDRPFAIVGVNGDTKEKLKEVVANGATTWRNFTDDQEFGKISASWGINVWPGVYLIDPNGVIKYKDLRGEEMDKAILEMLAEAEKVKKS